MVLFISHHSERFKLLLKCVKLVYKIENIKKKEEYENSPPYARTKNKRKLIILFNIFIVKTN